MRAVTKRELCVYACLSVCLCVVTEREREKERERQRERQAERERERDRERGSERESCRTVRNTKLFLAERETDGDKHYLRDTDQNKNKKALV